ncbi:MAG: ATP-binding protein [Thermoprotei archaeon]
MNLQEIKRVIASQREEMGEKFRRTKIIKREVGFEKLKGVLSHPNILAILGIRRCGKSVFAWQLLEEEKFGHINFDDERLFGIRPTELDLVLQAFYELYGDLDFVVLDEPQNVVGWELFVNRLRLNKRVVVTGSNSRLLGGELATHLTGRHVDFTLTPFSFREHLAYTGVDFSPESLGSAKKVSEIKRRLEEYVRMGGMPEAHLFGREILVRIYADIVERDVLGRLRIRRGQAFREFAKYLASNIGSEYTYSKLSHIFDIKDVHTVRNWLGGLEAAYLYFSLERYSPKLKESVIAPKKLYCLDNGLALAISLKEGRVGRLIENVVAVELLRRRFYWAPFEVYYWKDHTQREVDFVLKVGDRVDSLIQVSYASDEGDIEKREITALVKAGDTLKCRNTTIITWDYEGELKTENMTIECTPLWKWLLKQPSNTESN